MAPKKENTGDADALKLAAALGKASEDENEGALADLTSLVPKNPDGTYQI